MATCGRSRSWSSGSRRRAGQLGDTVLTALLRPEDGPEANQRLAALLAELGYAVAFVRPGRDLPRRRHRRAGRREHAAGGASGSRARAWRSGCIRFPM